VPSVSHVPQLHLQIFSAGQITDHGCRIILDSDACSFHDRRIGILVGSGRRLRDPPHLWELDWLHLLPVKAHDVAFAATPCVASASTSFAQWHRRLGHMCGSRLSSLVTSGVLGKVTGDTPLPCMGCRLGKQIELPYLVSQIVSTRPFELIHSDVWGPSPFVSKGAIDIMSYLLMIYHASHGSISWTLELNCLLPIKPLLRWFALSLTLPFVSFVLTLSVSIYLVFFTSFFLSRVLFLSSCAPVLMLRMVLLSVSIVTFLRLLGHCYLPHLFLLSSGLKLSLPLFIL
jgi:hypothetical protein